MRQAHQQLTVSSSQGRGLYEFTHELRDWVSSTGIQAGLLTVFVQHTSASLLIQENADPTVQADLERFLARLVPDGDPIFQHRQEGKDDMSAHARTALTQIHLAIPVVGGAPMLGAWQGVFLYEHRYESQSRRVILHLLGE
ncbi:secondary thiamine-phosphate synthase enzyme YjbQ [Sulfuricella sp.]|uniref:secondary thiamine-phosphate synthase enzyme YjbQ n=1 Tax=Sulfuricella sp. TaxID=2099377 RepID=UPI002CA4554A|nr:secondary thiamine-phosphate synthase enzyme YjbQ [Sulfuricella sp.]HUX63999.1 secondary thiamine-phosphate synthase enzyme YjbQ [Sulfuricella sp.]